MAILRSNMADEAEHIGPLTVHLLTSFHIQKG